MRALTRSELILLTFCFLTVFLVGNGIAWKSYRAKVEEVESELAVLEAQRLVPKTTGGSEPQGGDEKEEFWKIRMAWLDEQLPKMEGRDRAQADLLEWMQERAVEHDLYIQNQSFMKPGGSKHYSEIGVTMKVFGLERQVIQWLAEMQSPTRFQAIKFLSLEPRDWRNRNDPHGARPVSECTLTLARWFKP